MRLVSKWMMRLKVREEEGRGKDGERRKKEHGQKKKMQELPLPFLGALTSLLLT
jgi:hypothetical protein